MVDEPGWERSSQSIGRRRLGLLGSGQPVAVFLAARRKWISHSESLSCRRRQLVSTRGGTETGSRCGGKAFLRAESVRSEWLIGHGDTAGRARKWPGAEVGSNFGIAPVKLVANATGALPRRQVASGAADRRTDHGHMGAARLPEDPCAALLILAVKQRSSPAEFPGRQMDTPST